MSDLLLIPFLLAAFAFIYFMLKSWDRYVSENKSRKGGINPRRKSKESSFSPENEDLWLKSGYADYLD